jgi:hypothetical protein
LTALANVVAYADASEVVAIGLFHKHKKGSFGSFASN